MYVCRIATVLVLVAFSFQASAQVSGLMGGGGAGAFSGFSGGGGGGAQLSDSTDNSPYGPHTATYIYERDWYENRRSFNLLDTSILFMNRYDHPSRLGFQFHDLGTVGTAINPVFFLLPRDIGTRFGMRNVEPYMRPTNQVRYYNTRSPLSDWYYAQGGDGRAVLDINMARNVNPNWSLGFGYTRLNSRLLIGQRQQGRNSNQANHQTFLGHTRFETKDERYRLMAHFQLATHTNSETGGLRTEDFLNDSTTYDDLFRQNIGQLSNRVRGIRARKVENRGHVYHQYSFFRKREEIIIPDSLRKKPDERKPVRSGAQPNPVASVADSTAVAAADSTKTATADSVTYRYVALPILQAFHSGTYTYQEFAYSDASFAGNRNFYQRFLGTQTVPANPTYNILMAEWDNRAGIKGTIGDFFYAGYLRHRFFRQAYQPNPTEYIPIRLPSQQSVGSDFSYTLLDTAIFRSSAERLIGGGSDYRLSAEAITPYGQAWVRQMHYQPDRAQSFWLTPFYNWNNSFAYTTARQWEIAPRAVLSLPRGRVVLEPFIGGTRVNNHIYFDTLARPVQYDGLLTYRQAGLRFDVQTGSIRQVGSVTYTRSTADSIMPMPEWLATYQIFFERSLFNDAIFVQLGLDFNWRSAYYALGYMPINQQFHLQFQQPIGNYLYTEAFLNFRVRRVRMFVKMPNLGQQFIGPGLYTTPGYMGIRRTIEFGVHWLLFD